MHPKALFTLARCIFLALLLVSLPFAASAQVEADNGLDTSAEIPAPGENSAQEDAELQEEPSGFAYTLSTGALAVSADTAAAFCPDSGIIVVHPHHVAETLDTFNAADNGDGTWSVPDPDTGDVLTVNAQFAEAVFDDGRGGADAAELVSLASLPVISSEQVVQVRWLWPRCWRLRLHYRCGVQGTCPWNGRCINGYFFSQTRNFLTCTYAPWNLCLEFLYPVCRVTRYTCKDCTGPIIYKRPLNRYVCAVF